MNFQYTKSPHDSEFSAFEIAQKSILNYVLWIASRSATAYLLVLSLSVRDKPSLWAACPEIKLMAEPTVSMPDGRPANPPTGNLKWVLQ